MPIHAKMPISRPLLIALVAAVVALVGFYAFQGARDASNGGDTVAEVAPSAPAQATKSAPKAETRQRDRAEAARRRGMPLAVSRALDARRIVVVLFRGSDSADDRAAARAVASLRGQRGLAVFTDRIGGLGRYRAVVGDLGISQAPAVVIVDKGRTARVVQGYIDPATLAQDVADAR